MLNPPPIMQDKVKSSYRLTAIQCVGGLTLVAPTDQWIALLFDALHPTQQEGIIERLKEMSDAQSQDKPLVEIPGSFTTPGEHLRR